MTAHRGEQTKKAGGEHRSILDDPRGRKGVVIGLIGLAAGCFFGVPPLVAFFQHETRATDVTDSRWQQSTSLPSTAFWAAPAAVAYGDGRWVTVGSEGTDPHVRPTAWVSTDGKHWRAVTVPMDTTPDTTEAAMTSVAYAHGRWVAVGSATAFGNLNAAVWSSTDGKTWQRVSSRSLALGGAGTQVINSIYADTAGYVAAGYEDFGGDANAAFWRSTDGVNWQRVSHNSSQLTEPGDQVVTALTLTARGLLVAGGKDQDGENSDAAIWTSPDAITWTRDRDAPELGGPRGDAISGLTASSHAIVAVGSTALDGDTNAEAWTSNDGTHWTRASDDPEVLGGDMEQSMHAVTSVAGSFVAVGTDASAGEYDPTVWSSQNGMTWVRVHNEAVFDVARRTLMLAVATNGTQIVTIGTMDNGLGQSGAAWRRRT